MKKQRFEYSVSSRTLIVTDDSGQEMRIGNLSREQAEAFAAKHGEAFIARAFRLETSGPADFSRA